MLFDWATQAQMLADSTLLTPKAEAHVSVGKFNL